MKRVLTLHDPLLAGHLGQVLEHAGIRCLVKNQHLIGAVGDLPPLEAWPEIWVIHDEDVEPARALLAPLAEQAAPARESWVCPACGERLEAQFTECWRCAGSAPSTFTA